MALRATSEYAQSRYDEVAEGYDRLWTHNVTAPHARLTAGLKLRRGERICDVACGTGAFTLDMARMVTPGEVVAVDLSWNMLDGARERFPAESLPLTCLHAEAGHFLTTAEAASFDVVSLRFLLAYVDYREVLPRVTRILRPGGRVGVLTSTTASIPQAFKVYDDLRREAPRTAWRLFQFFRKDLGRGFKLMRHLKQTFGSPTYINVPDSGAQVVETLRRGGLVPLEQWDTTVRMWFSDAHRLVDWLVESGYAAHPGLQRVDQDGMRFLRKVFVEGLEEMREPQGVPLDLVMTGVIAQRR